MTRAAMRTTKILAAPVRDRVPSRALSERERDVLRLIAAGGTDRQIADALCVSRHTVGNHVRHILGKLAVPTRAAAVAQAVRDEIL
jgi:DNA-binding CsgD family transcriptional regulator